eukprot:jgi/Mesen1/7100/ME000369S06427
MASLDIAKGPADTTSVDETAAASLQDGNDHSSRSRAPIELDETSHLLFFASQGHIEEIREILDRGVNVNTADYDGRTALHLAASEGQLAVIRLLLERGADVNPRDRWGSTPFADAKRYGYKDVCQLLEERGGKLAAGAFGEIRVVGWRGTRVAVKTILTQLSSQPKVEREFREELALLQKLRHPNIVQFLGAVTQSQPQMLVTEYLSQGDLHEILKREGALTAEAAVGFALDIARRASGVVALGRKGGVWGSGKGRALRQATGLPQKLRLGPSGKYMAPEVFRHEAYDKSVDVYSFAIIVQEMFEGGPSFRMDPPAEVAQKYAYDNVRPAFRAKTYPKGMPEGQERPSFSKILERLEEIERGLHEKKQSSPAGSDASSLRCHCAIL